VFLIFCLEFLEVLERTDELRTSAPQSGFWHYHAYWFEYLGKKRKTRSRSLGHGSSFALLQENMASRPSALRRFALETV